ncbi:xanthine dehydrogenase family protein molybdopterin-binding subunit [Marinitenerispora sediminis]|uniref:Carbon monoxide dehydrogenase n=1 Tax=Marinitenerispora sediminis TaxID=1931232 RepID=A0A368T3J1_9ACTN|nr:xanthine dehydrogenase family protein molybdopterin-binding subunit [Marinitenerispora sediminis]RCV49497.1 carbon monoxide dehydrogenase [Marinitenerispora sediminis]RCV52600.1 carbon monoxide dehydrogenase [Marinitenerispora sediminis]RCV56874.1 carbon monoxide dehydrogenase [Marinitenerispora sediminis]
MTHTTLPRTTVPDRAVGRPLDRVDGAAKATGTARYSAEYPLPDLAHAALVHAAVSRGRITGIDTSAAAAVPGVITVLTHENAPRMKPPPPTNLLRPSAAVSSSTVNLLNTDEVFWDGQPVAVVVAETTAAAREAAGLVRVDYQRLPATVDFAAAQSDAVPQKGNAIMPAGVRKGDAEAALASAAVSVDLRFTTPPQQHNALEPHATTAHWDGDRLTVHDATQSLDWLRHHLALRFAVPVENVRVIAPYVGGGFGGKGSVWAGTVLTVLAARAIGRPVRMALTRHGVNRTVGGRTPTSQRVALGAGTDGRITALVHTSVARTGRTGGSPEPVTSMSRHLYDAENILLQQSTVELDLLPNTYMRAPGEAVGSFALESAVDELAHRLAIDPVELRMRNEPAADPVSGKRFSQRLLREAYALGAERFGWSHRSARPGSMRDGRWLVGMGVASAYFQAMRMTSDVAVRFSVDGGVLVRCGLQDMGMGSATAQAQIAADALGVPFEAVRVEYGDSALPTAPGAGGSAQTASVASGLLRACEKLNRRLDALARRTGTVGESRATTLAHAGLPSVEAAVGSDTRLGRLAGQARLVSTVVRDQQRWVRAASGAHFCEVRVDPDTGEVRIARWLGVFDVGTVINAKTAASQLRGGIIMGIGMALTEQTLVDPRTGRNMNPGLDTYHVPVHADIPPIDVTWLGEPDPTMPLGLLGVGEVGTTGVAAAVANAVHHATGRRVRDLPITLDKVV